MDSWVKLEDVNYNGILIHEVKCPYCGYRITYNDKFDTAPKSCYVCGRELGEEN